MHPLEYFLTNEHEEEWVPDSSVRESLAQFDMSQASIKSLLNRGERKSKELLKVFKLDVEPEDAAVVMAYTQDTVFRL